MHDAADLQERLRQIRGDVAPRLFGTEDIHWLSETCSTNDDCRRLTEEAGSRPVVVLADRQTAGRGQYGRTWEAPPGLGVLMSLSVSFPQLENALLTAWASAAAAIMLERTFSLRATVKWPNDVLIDGRKIAGVLVEVRGFAVVGIGLNVLQRAEHFPSDCRLPPTSIAIETGVDADRLGVAISLLDELERLGAPTLADARDAIVDAWRSRLDVRPGQTVVAAWTEGTHTGELLDLDPINGLRLRTSNSVVRIPGPRLLRVESCN